MKQAAIQSVKPTIRIGKIDTLDTIDMENLCEATEEAISDGIGFRWVTPPVREVMEAYWKGVLVIPERQLFGAWMDNTLCGTIQLIKPPRSKETSYFRAKIEGHFVTPWARGHGIAGRLLDMAEREASSSGFRVIRLTVRETQEHALRIYHEAGYTCWGILPCHEYVGGQMIAGHYFYKELPHASNVE